METLRSFHRLFKRLPIPFEEVAGEGVLQVFLHGAIHIFPLETAVKRAIEEEIKHTARLGFAAIRFDGTDDVIAGDGTELDVDLPDDADARTARHIRKRQAVEVLNDACDILFVRCVGLAGKDGFDAALLPAAAESLCAAGLFLIRACAVEALLQRIAVDDGLDHAPSHRKGEMEARLWLEAMGIEGDHGDIRKPRFV